MTYVELEDVRAIIEDWRERAKNAGDREHALWETLGDCADELEALPTVAAPGEAVAWISEDGLRELSEGYRVQAFPQPGWDRNFVALAVIPNASAAGREVGE